MKYNQNNNKCLCFIHYNINSINDLSNYMSLYYFSEWASVK